MYKLIPSIIEKDYFNTEQNFLLSDCKKSYDYNYIHQPKDWQWRDTHISYKLNELGYRTLSIDNIDWKNSIVILGCSLVFGIGVPEKDTIPSIIQRKTGIPTINLGVPSGSNYHSFYNSFLIKENFPDPKAIIFSYTSPDRYMSYMGDDHQNIINSIGPWDDHTDWFNIQTTTSRIWHLTQLRRVFQLLYKNNNYLECSPMKSYANAFTEVLSLSDNAPIDRGRDEPIRTNANFDSLYAHPGPKTNEIYADMIIKNLKL
jgi:hypothetical protein